MLPEATPPEHTQKKKKKKSELPPPPLGGRPSGSAHNRMRRIQTDKRLDQLITPIM